MATNKPSVFVLAEAKALAQKYSGARVSVSEPGWPRIDALLFGHRVIIGGVVGESGSANVYIRSRSGVSLLRSYIADRIFGSQYRWPHDYVVLRRRFAYHRGAYGWIRKWRFFGRVLSICRHNGRMSARLYQTSQDHDPEWREMTNSRIAPGWTIQ